MFKHFAIPRLRDILEFGLNNSRFHDSFQRKKGKGDSGCKSVLMNTVMAVVAVVVVVVIAVAIVVGQAF